MLLEGGRRGRAPGRRRARNTVLRLGFRGEIPGGRHRRIRVVLCPRRDAQPVRGVQPEDQVLGAVGEGRCARVRHGGHRPLCPAFRWAAAPRRGPRQGPVLRAGRAERRAAAPRRVPDRGHPQITDPRRSRSPRPGRRRKAGQSRHLLHPVGRHPRLLGLTHRGSPRLRGQCGRDGARRARRGARLHHRAAQRAGHRRAGSRRPPPLRDRDRRRDRDRAGGGRGRSRGARIDRPGTGIHLGCDAVGADRVRRAGARARRNGRRRGRTRRRRTRRAVARPAARCRTGPDAGAVPADPEGDEVLGSAVIAATSR